MGLGGSSSDGSDWYREQEQQRQAAIREGTGQINAIFDGGNYVTGKLGNNAAFDPNATYYNADGSQWTYEGDPTAVPEMSVPDMENPIVKGLTMGLMGQPQSAFDKARSEGLYTEAATTTGFTDDFYANQRQAYLDYATPQLEDQRNEANKQMLFSLARNGQLEGSARAELAGDLQKQYDLQSQQVTSQALDYENQSRNNVESARSDLIAMLNATGDATGAANSALARSEALSQPTAYSPVSNLFADFTSALGTQAAAERAYYYGGGPKPTYTTGLFGTPSGAVSVRN